MRLAMEGNKAREETGRYIDPSKCNNVENVLHVLTMQLYLSEDRVNSAVRSKMRQLYNVAEYGICII